MHELPKDLTNSLRSFRGSIYGSKRKPELDGQEVKHPDLEKGSSEDYGDNQFEQALSETDDSSRQVRITDDITLFRADVRY